MDSIPDSHSKTAVDGPDDSAESVLSGSGLGATFTSLTAEEASELAMAHYAIHGELTRFATEKDDTFRILTPGGESFVLKISNPAEPLAEIDFQVELLEFIAQTSAHLPVPKVFPNKTGQRVTAIRDSVGQSRQMRLLSFLDGQVLDSTHSTAQQREKIGQILARLRLATAGFSHSYAQRKLAWDVQHVQSLASLLTYVEAPAQRQQLEKALQLLQAHVSPKMEGLRKQVLHNDFSQSNIVVNHDDPDFVTGIIDFGDCVHTAIAIDVSTALLNQLPRDADRNPVDDLFAQGRDVLRGYLSMADLLPEERALLPHLVMARVVARALLTHWRATLLPHNAPYILRNTRQGWAQLDWFLSHNADELFEWLL